MAQSEERAGSARTAARAAADGKCPRCNASRRPGQSYCLECGLRLPVVSGVVAALRRGWLRRVGWYPGDWIWAALPALAVAVAGAAVSIAVTAHGGATTGTTTVSPASASGGTSLAAAAEPRAASPRSGSPKQRGRTEWPAVSDGWTVVLGSYPATGGEAVPRAAATRAARAGLPEVGVLDSSAFSSLHPGYLVVFSGIYSAPTDADTALRTAHARGFGSAYSREVSR